MSRTPINKHEGRKYLKTIRPALQETGEEPIRVDVYCVLEAYNVRCQAVCHAIKKLLMAGQRGKGGYEADLTGAIAAINRGLDLATDRMNEAAELGGEMTVDMEDLKDAYDEAYRGKTETVASDGREQSGVEGRVLDGATFVQNDEDGNSVWRLPDDSNDDGEERHFQYRLLLRSPEKQEEG